ncbi:outer membrane protein transport protein [Shewanella sp. SR44-4]|jgi:long-chain fatty acid transport protein|uniref:outer membrane protein transport protein n=1 Tax=unclassified Shewanella TaxID=196818 RepID=UPI000C341F55|nr:MULTISPECIES: outer membrane protein transport protein [unclassified Shewanella]MBB1362257.1 outer membrane protein transport protein [Shewanella sp. SR44-4]MBO1897981.1 outer membrane protein transport protein [Shewanella sp. BF02_Schw]PKH28338.1 aromatic hydrocarbon degradation protein [Shewanella sp. ALD9]
MKKTVLTLAISAIVFGATTQVNAAGFQLAEYSATGLGRAFAGEAAIADNASTQARNPAMLAYLEGRQVSAGGIYVMPNVDVVGDVGISSPLLGSEPLVIGADAYDVADNAFVPNFYYSNQLNDQWTWGLAVNSNYGLATDIPVADAAAIFGSKTSITTVEFNPNVAFRIDDSFTVGAGLRVVYGEGEVSATAPGWIDAIKANPNLPASINARLPSGGTNLKSMEGDDVGYGWKAGASWQINSANRIGLAYHSSVDLKLDGHVSGVAYNGGQNIEIEGYLPIELPAFAELASYHQLTENWAMHASVNWTEWSVFEQLVAYFPGDVKPVGGLESDVVKEENFKDNWRYALGTTYTLNDQWTLRAGMALDTTAVDDQHRTTTIPDSDRLWFSVGTGYQVSKNLNVDVGVTYIRTYGDAPITETQGLQDLAAVSFTGEATGDVWLTGVQLSYKM